MKSAKHNSAIVCRAAAVLLVCLFSWLSATAQSHQKLEIRTLSSRPDMVSGGDALVEVKTPVGVTVSQLTLTLNGKDVTGQLKEEGAGNFRGLIAGMTVGKNTLRAAIKSGAAGERGETSPRAPPQP